MINRKKAVEREGKGTDRMDMTTRRLHEFGIPADRIMPCFAGSWTRKIGTPYYRDRHPRSPILPVTRSAIEICIDCSTEAMALENALASHEGGADRLECCARMDVGGLTPDPRFLERIRRALTDGPEILAMIRPRDGGFEFSDAEVRGMRQDIADAARASADGVVIGALKDGLPDRQALDILCAEARQHGLRTTFHRAFDATKDRAQALDMLLAYPVHRILSAGTAWDGGEPASRGVEILLALGRQSAGRIEWVIGGGVGAANLGHLDHHLASVRPRSFHAFSSVLTDGRTDAGRVATLVAMLNAGTQDV